MRHRTNGARASSASANATSRWMPADAVCADMRLGTVTGLNRVTVRKLRREAALPTAMALAPTRLTGERWSNRMPRRRPMGSGAIQRTARRRHTALAATRSRLNAATPRLGTRNPTLDHDRVRARVLPVSRPCTSQRPAKIHCPGFRRSPPSSPESCWTKTGFMNAPPLLGADREWAGRLELTV